jgi:hypothetical protein
MDRNMTLLTGAGIGAGLILLGAAINQRRGRMALEEQGWPRRGAWPEARPGARWRCTAYGGTTCSAAPPRRPEPAC